MIGVLAVLLLVGSPPAAQDTATPPPADLRPGVSRTYAVETTLLSDGTKPDSTSRLTIELTTSHTGDGRPTLLYRSVSMTGSYDTELIRVLVKAFDRTPIEVELGPGAQPTGVVDWPHQGLRIGEAIRNAGDELGIDADRWAVVAERFGEEGVIDALVNEVVLIAEFQAPGLKREIIAIDRQTCTISVRRRFERPADVFGTASEIDATAEISLRDGWVVRYRGTSRDSTPGDPSVVHRYDIRLANPPTQPCPVT